MAVFDLKTFLELQGQGGGTFTSLGSAFGMPACMLNLGNEVLSLLPSSILGSMDRAANIGRSKANEITKNVFKLLLLNTGIIEFDTEQGIFKFLSDSSEIGSETAEGSLLNDLNSFLNTAEAAAGAAGQLYRNYESTVAQIEALQNCLTSFNEIQKFQNGNSADQKHKLSDEQLSALTEAEYRNGKKQLEDAKNFIEAADSLRSNINEILSQREQNPALEPVFLPEYESLVDGTTFTVDSDSTDTDETGAEIIRLDYGPPKAISGQFLLSEKGLYYNSQTEEGITPVLTFIDDQPDVSEGEKWKFDYDPNVGGKGEQIDEDFFSKYVGTIFDVSVPDNSEFLQPYYEKDHFLQVLSNQKEKRILDVSGQLETLEKIEDSLAIIENTKQMIISEVARHNEKINKRKKQIEVAVKAPSLFGASEIYKPGEVPINDFSYLQGLNLNLDASRQRALVLDQEEVSGIVLPLKPVFVESKDAKPSEILTDLYTTRVGVGAIIADTPVDLPEGGPSLPVTDAIASDELIAVYNFLEPRTVVPGSEEFRVTNCVSHDDYGRAQMVAASSQEVFFKGLGIPFLKGITVHDSTNTDEISALGSYVKLPDITEFRDFTYNPKGFTFESWAYVPHLDDEYAGWGNSDVSSLYRLLLSCENTGIASGTSPQSDPLNLNPDFGSDVVRGMLLGFTRDRRYTQGSDPSNDPLDHPTDAVKLVLAPTQSVDSSTVGLVSYQSGECALESSYRGMTVDYYKTVNNVSLSSVAEGFVLLTVSVDYPKDEIKVYVDSQLIETSAVSEVFGTTPRKPINIPSFKLNNSFEYDEDNLATGTPTLLTKGPKLNTFFTPWILGGGYTDGIPDNNFMGSTYYGISSGLNGHIGSAKFYLKPLDYLEIKKNFENQSLFFKNIDTVNTNWEPIE